MSALHHGASAGSRTEVVIGTFSAAVAHLGSARQPGTGQENGVGIGVASDAQLYCVGHFEGFAEFGGEGHAAAGRADGFVVRLNPLSPSAVLARLATAVAAHAEGAINGSFWTESGQAGAKMSYGCAALLAHRHPLA